MATLINLLPDLRQEKARSRQRRRLAKGVLIGVAATCFGTVAVLFLVTLGQQIRIRQLSDNINTKQDQIKSVPDLPKILTTQQQLNTLATLYPQKVYLTKLYALLSNLEPKDVSLQSLSLDPQNTLTLTALARNYGVMSKFVKAMEASNVSIGFGASPNNQPYFSNFKLGSAAANNSNQIGFSLSATMSTEVTRGPK